LQCRHRASMGPLATVACSLAVPVRAVLGAQTEGSGDPRGQPPGQWSSFPVHRRGVLANTPLVGELRQTNLVQKAGTLLPQLGIERRDLDQLRDRAQRFVPEPRLGV